jgi:hypothetical protein
MDKNLNIRSKFLCHGFILLGFIQGVFYGWFKMPLLFLWREHILSSHCDTHCTNYSKYKRYLFKYVKHFNSTCTFGRLQSLTQFWVILLKWHPDLGYIMCRNPNLGLTTKARACEGASQEWSSRITFHILGSVGECEGMTSTLPSELPL